MLGLLVLSAPVLPAGEDQDGQPQVPVAQTVLDELAEAGTTDFWVVVDSAVDLSAAYEIDDWAPRGEYVYERLTAAARASQQELVAELADRGVDYETFWINNSVLVRGADRATLTAATGVHGVAEIRADEPVQLPDPIDDDAAGGEGDARTAAVEWGIANIGADRVWNDFSARGDGIVVGSIDSGVDYTHPVLVGQYRGNLGGGAFDHNYQWWDPSSVCGSPSLAPCDNNGHGSHTMGTMVGDDHDGNQIGVAPNARWIAAKGCESSSCSQFALLSAGQFMLAPTDLGGANPRPDLRPQVVNNSWGGGGGNPWYDGVVAAWSAAGMIGVFSNGNSGPACGTTGSPADGPDAWAVGAYDITDTIADFSSRGPGRAEEIRPHISAPGVDVRSSFPGDRYAIGSGTSMAAPHQSGAVALIWSAAPALIGNLTETRQLLADTAIDTDDQSCGGTAGHNNVYGHGRLDAYAAVQAAPRGPTGSLVGTVIDAATDAPFADVTVSIEIGTRLMTARTAADGTYRFGILPVGGHDVTARLFGYASETSMAEVVEGQEITLEFALEPVPSHPVSGTVVDDLGGPLLGANVTLVGTPVPPTTTDADGQFSFPAVPEGSYEIGVDAGGCFAAKSVETIVDGPVTIDVQLAQGSDEHGYTCRVMPASYIEATEIQPLPAGSRGGDAFRRAVPVELPFPFPFYDTGYGDTAYISEPGYLTFTSGNSIHQAFPIPGDVGDCTPFGCITLPVPRAAIYGFWDNILLDDQSQLLTSTLGVEGDRRFVVEWRNARICLPSYPGCLELEDVRVDFEIVLAESGEILLQYRGIDPDNERARGSRATIGIENAGSTDALQFSHLRPVLSDAHAIRFMPPAGGLVTGMVTDANDGAGRSGVTVTATSGEITRTVTTNEDGAYALRLPPGAGQVEFRRSRYAPQSREVDIVEGVPTIIDAELETAAAVAEPAQIDTTLVAGEQQSFQVEVTNTSSTNLDWRAAKVALQAPASLLPPERTPGDLVTQWLVSGESPDVDPGVRGIGYADGKIWVAALDSATRNVINREYARDGTPTGRQFETPWAQPFGEFEATDLVFDPRRGWMCQGVGGFQGRIVCWDPESGEVTGSLAGRSWSQLSPRALAYNARDDVFYTGGGSRIFRVAGFSHPVPGEVLGECSHDLGGLSGLAYHDPAGVLWAAAAGTDPTLHRLDPDDCTNRGTLSPASALPIVALAVDERGDLWVVTQWHPGGTGIPSLVQAFAGQDVSDLTWLETNVSEGSLAPGENQQLGLSINTSDLDPGLYEADLVLVTNGGRDLRVPVPVKLEVAPGPHGTLTGVVTDANDGKPVAGAAVTAISDADGDEVRATSTAEDGSYQLPLEVAFGTWTVTVEADRYVTETTQVTFTEDGQEHSYAPALRTGVAEVDPQVFETVVRSGSRATVGVRLSNAGSADLVWEHTARPGDGPAPGEVVTSWEAEQGAVVGIGVVPGGTLWLAQQVGESDAEEVLTNREYRLDGTPTGREFSRPDVSAGQGAMVYDPGRGLMCQYVLDELLEGRIDCWDPDTGEVRESMTGSPWNTATTAHIAYNPSDDIFYLTGSVNNDGQNREIYQIAGFSHPEAGTVLTQCTADWSPAPARTTPIAYSPATGSLWLNAFEGADQYLFQVDPASCAQGDVLTPAVRISVAQEMSYDESGNVWLSRPFSQGFGNSFQVATGEVPWLALSPAGGELAPGEHQNLGLAVDATQLSPGVYDVEIVLDTNARQPRTTLQMRVTVTEPVPCTRTVTGTYVGQLVVGEGVTCIADGARVTGPVTVQEGAGLVVGTATITGPVTAAGAELVELVGGQVTGPVTIGGTTGRVTIAGNQITGSVRLADSTTGDRPVFVSGNRIEGSLACSGNDPAPIDGGIPNTVTGRSTGQCAGW